MYGLCRSCKHFVNRKRGKNGGLKGMCELSNGDKRNFYSEGYLRPPGVKHTCKNFKWQEDRDGI